MIQLCANLTQLLIAYDENQTKCRFPPEIYEVLQQFHLEINHFIRTRQNITIFINCREQKTVTFYI